MKLSRLVRKLLSPSPCFFLLGFSVALLLCRTQFYFVPEGQYATLFEGKRASVIANLARRPVLIGMPTAEKYLLTRAKTVFETWGKKVENLTFFVGADCDTTHPDLAGMKFVKLPGVPDAIYPPRKKTFAMFEYMARHYVDQFHWFMRADDDVYIDNVQLMHILYKLDPAEKLYIGHPAVGRKEDKDRLQLRANENYCMGGTASMVSRALLKSIQPYLGTCLASVFEHDVRVNDSTMYWIDDDVELGRCIGRTLNIQCTPILDYKLLFHQDYDDDANDAVALWSKFYTEALSVHPIKERTKMLKVHHFFSAIDYAKSKRQLSHLEWDLDSTCGALALNPTRMTSAIPFNIIFELCAGDEDCMCSKESVDTKLYHTRRGLIVPGRENTWLQYIGSDEFQSGIIETHTPANSMQSQTVNVTDHFVHLRQVAKMQANEAFFVGGFVQYSLLLGLHLFVDMKSEVSEEGGEPGNVITRYQFISNVPTEVTVATQVLQPAVEVALVVVVDSLDRNITKFISSNLNVLKSADPIVKSVFIAVGDTEVAASVTQAVSSSRHSKAIAEIESYTGVTSWLKGAEAGLSKLPDSMLVFLSDASSDITPDFLNRCRTLLSGYSNRLYHPIPTNCVSSDNNCNSDASNSRKYRFLVGYVSEVRSWLDQSCSDSELRNVFLATALDPLLKFSSNSGSECCHHPHLFCS